MTPTDDLHAVLEEITKIEARPGFGGPKISKWISDATAFLGKPRIWGTPDDRMIQLLYVDAVVGEIIRAVKARRKIQPYLDQWVLDLSEGGDGHWVVFVHTRDGRYVSSAQGDLPWAMATAYLGAIDRGRQETRVPR